MWHKWLYQYCCSFSIILEIGGIIALKYEQYIPKFSVFRKHLENNICYIMNFKLKIGKNSNIFEFLLWFLFLPMDSFLEFDIMLLQIYTRNFIEIMLADCKFSCCWRLAFFSLSFPYMVNTREVWLTYQHINIMTVYRKIQMFDSNMIWTLRHILKPNI